MADFLANSVQSSHDHERRPDDKLDGAAFSGFASAEACEAYLLAVAAMATVGLKAAPMIEDAPRGEIWPSATRKERAHGQHDTTLMHYQPRPMPVVTRDINGGFHFDWPRLAQMAAAGDWQAAMLLAAQAES